MYNDSARPVMLDVYLLINQAQLEVRRMPQ
jgi:hypothetical protein